MSTKTHTQAIDTYQGSDLLAGMVWVDGYGAHYLIKEVSVATLHRIVDGFLSTTYDYTRSVIRLHPLDDRQPSITLTISNSDEFDIAKA